MPKPPSGLTVSVSKSLRALLDRPDDPENLAASLRLLSKWRVAVIENTVRARCGDWVLSGPFKGMSYTLKATEGAGLPRRLGCYEAALRPVIDEIIAKKYRYLWNIGCADGYYAVGLARVMTSTQVLAFDADPHARAVCAALAEQNNVSERISVGAEVTHELLKKCVASETVIICDIEGAEGALLDPQKAPSLKHVDILVEAHDCLAPDLSRDLVKRFEASHHITQIDRHEDMSELPEFMHELADLDRVLSAWEWRIGPTPWLWMQSKATTPET